MYYGVDYYPEHWPRERWEQDADLMAAAGINVVRMAEFAWCRMEPQPGRLDFSWLDAAVSILGARGIRTILGTPTAAPPIWLTRRHPEMLAEDAAGRPWREGSRRHCCFNSLAYREHSRRITRAMAGHYAHDPHVVGWQIDNEFACHQSRCCCANCRRAWHGWLAARYGSVGALNQAWGAVVWSQEYQEWADVPPLWRVPALPNPSLALDYYRFSSDAVAAFQQEQVQILRDLCPGHLITHNTMGLFRDVDYYKLGAQLDVLSWDNYPGFVGDGPPAREASTALAHDLVRGIRGQNFWVMEAQSGATTWKYIGPQPKPGQIRLWALQAVAHGADAVVYFCWRTNRVGAEQFWHGILDHPGEPGRRYREVAETGQELAALAPVLQGTTVDAQVALLHDYAVSWAFEIQHHHPNFQYLGQFQDWHRALAAQGYAVDVVPFAADLGRYRLVIIPSPFLVGAPLVDRLTAFVRGGGTLVITPRAGVKDEHNVVSDQTPPGLLAPLAGATVAEYDSLWGDQSLVWEGQRYQVRGWADVLAPADAEPLAVYGGDYYAGQPALTRARRGAGSVYYLGTLPEAPFYGRLVAHLAAAAGLEPLGTPPPGVELQCRVGEGRRVWFALNHTGSATVASVAGRQVPLAAWGAAVWAEVGDRAPSR